MNWLRFGRDLLFGLGILAAVVTWWAYTFTGMGQPVDAHAYWAADPANLYPNADLAKDGYYYSPAFEFIAASGRLVPFEVFIAVWRAILLAALVYLAGPFTLFMLLWPPVASEVNAGNVQILLALVAVVGLRHPAAWSFAVLTKGSPAVGMLWFAVRREWRALAVAIGATAVIVVASLIVHGGQWPAYIALIAQGKAPSVSPYFLTLWVRLPFAVAIVVIGALRGWRWTVPVAAMLALPVFYVISLSMLVGVLPYARERLGKLLTDHGWTLTRGRPARVRAPSEQHVPA